jgi:branched-chain amino acid transport system substrate-binding protein
MPVNRFIAPPPLAALLLWLGTAGCAPSAPDTVVLGLASPLGTPYGASMRMGAELAQQEVNRAGTLRLELRVRDDKADPRVAIAVADEFFNDSRVVGVIGHVNSGTTAAAAEIYEKGLPSVATSATSPSISRLGEWIFRVATSDSMNAVEMARRAARTDSTAAVLYANDDYGRGLSSSFAAAYAATGGRVVEMDPYLESTQDFAPYLERLRRSGVGLIVVAGLEDSAARLIRQARELGLRARFLGGDGLEGLPAIGPDFEGTMVGLLYHPDASPESRSFAERFRAAYGREPDSFAALGYDAALLLARAVAEAGADRERVRAYLAGVGREGGVPAFAGVTGTLRFDASGDPVDKGFAVGVIRGGRIHLQAER